MIGNDSMGESNVDDDSVYNSESISGVTLQQSNNLSDFQKMLQFNVIFEELTDQRCEGRQTKIREANPENYSSFQFWKN